MGKIKISFVILLIIIVFSSCAKTEEKTNESTAYASVNGEIITVEEIEYFKGRNRADIINEYSEKYSITDFSDFWNSEYEGNNPTEALEQASLEDAVSAKIRLVMMREQGIYTDISFAALKKQAEDYNESHKNTTTVGINSIDLTSFYTYYIDTGEMELKNLLSESTLKPTDEETATYKESHPDATTEGAVSALTAEKYEKYTADLIAEATVTLF